MAFPCQCALQQLAELLRIPGNSVRVVGQGMFRIAICEDEKAQRDYLKRLLEQWQALSGEKASVEMYSSAEQFLWKQMGRRRITFCFRTGG